MQFIAKIRTYFQKRKYVRSLETAKCRYDNRGNDFTYTATQDELFRYNSFDLNNLRQKFADQCQKTLMPPIFFSENNAAYIIIDKIRYFLRDEVLLKAQHMDFYDDYDSQSNVKYIRQTLAEYVLSRNVCIVEPWRTFVTNPESAVVIAIRQKPLKGSFA